MFYQNTKSLSNENDNEDQFLIKFICFSIIRYIYNKESASNLLSFEWDKLTYHEVS
jgi:hypothetical protein